MSYRKPLVLFVLLLVIVAVVMSFRISWSPQRRDTDLSVSKAGTTLTVNGVAHDFSSLTDGGSVAAPNGDFVGPVTRVNGDIRAKLLLPLEPRPPIDRAFPADTLDAQGSVPLPAAGDNDDYVKRLLGSLPAPTGMYVRRASNVFYVGLGFPNGLALEHIFRFNPDGLLLWRGTKAGEQDATATAVGGVNPLKSSTASTVISENSVPDFAISARPDGSSQDAEWVPVHSSVTGVSGSITQVIKRSGTTIASSADFANTSATSFTIEQTFNALNPHGGGTLWQHTVNHTISFANPTLAIYNRVHASQDVWIGAGYLGMLALHTASVSDIKLLNSTHYTTIPTDGSDVPFDPSVVTSALAVGDWSSAYSVGAAITAKGAAFTADDGLVNFRADGTITKLYWRAIPNGSVLPTGTIIEGTQNVTVAIGPKATVRGLLQ